MSPDTITNLLHIVAGLLAGGLLGIEHSIPDRDTIPHDPTNNYAVGVLTCGIIIGLAYAAMGQLGTFNLTTALLTFWSVFIIGGAVVKACYWWDGRKTHAKERRLETQAQEIAEKTAAEIKKVTG